MSLPTKSEVHDDVVTILTVFTGKTPAQIQDAHDLQKDLQLKPDRLKALAISLRGFIKQHNPDGTTTSREVSRKDTTVAKLVDLIFKKITGAA